MSQTVFNCCLLTGWLMIVIGLALVSVPLALACGGGLLVLLTLLLARWAGVVATRKDRDVPHQ